MSIQFSPVVAARPRPIPGFTSLRYLDLDELGVSGSPLAVLDDFRVRSLPFSPHPHAGFSAVTYVFEDSDGRLRSRSSSGVDVVVGPGGIVWTHAGSGVIHEESPANRGRELHGVQIFVNLGAKNKLSSPKVLHLDGDEIPEWRNDGDDRVRVVVGCFDDVRSPLVPIEPFTLLDVALRRQISFILEADHNTVVYVRSGSVAVQADGHLVEVDGAHAVALRGGDASVTLQAIVPAQLLVLSGAEISEPVVAEGSFIMNEQAQIEAAIRRHRAGEMGQLEPLPGGG